MDEPKIRSIHVFMFLLFFWCVWLYTEVTDHISRSAHKAEVDAFINRGDRFTREMGDELEARIQALEAQEDVDLVNK